MDKERQKLFLIDGVGAIISAFFLGVILYRFNNLIGMPKDVLLILAIPACFFAIYSLSCYILKVNKWRPFMRGIAIANLLYCTVTLGMLVYYRASLNYLGYIYFIAEISIVVYLVKVEWKKANLG